LKQVESGADAHKLLTTPGHFYFASKIKLDRLVKEMNNSQTPIISTGISK